MFLLNEDNLLTTEPIDINLNQGDVNLDFVTLCDTFLNNITVNVNGSLFYTSHMVSTGGTGLPFRHLFLSSNQFGGVSVQVDGPFDNPGSYRFESFNLANSDNSVYSAPFGTADVELILEEYESNASDPTNPYLRPAHLKASFYGEIEQNDFTTGEVIGTLKVDGTIYID